MKTLFLLRHAKSSWKDSDLQDFDRPLNGRGKEAAEVIGRFIRKKRLMPDLLLSSPAVRARETIETIIKIANLQSELRFEERIYEAGSSRLAEIVSEIEDEQKSVMLVGHNPGMEELLRLLTDHLEHMETGTLAKIDLNGSSWSKALAEKGKLDWIVKPKELADG